MRPRRGCSWIFRTIWIYKRRLSHTKRMEDFVRKRHIQESLGQPIFPVKKRWYHSIMVPFVKLTKKKKIRVCKFKQNIVCMVSHPSGIYSVVSSHAWGFPNMYGLGTGNDLGRSARDQVLRHGESPKQWDGIHNHTLYNQGPCDALSQNAIVFKVCRVTGYTTGRYNEHKNSYQGGQWQGDTTCDIQAHGCQ